MTRTLSATSQAAVALDTTRPIYLIHMAWDAASPLPTYYRVATYDQAISWNSQTWIASGAEIQGISANGGALQLPIGEDDPWLALVQTEKARDRAIVVYEYHTDFSASPRVSDAVQVFAGFMDSDEISVRGIRIALVEGKTNKGFPPGSIRPPTYNHLLTKGSRLMWEQDIVTVE